MKAVLQRSPPAVAPNLARWLQHADGAAERLAVHPPAPPPLALYVHLPWCLAKCPYCDFNSHAVPAPHQGGLPERRYLDALVAAGCDTITIERSRRRS